MKKNIILSATLLSGILYAQTPLFQVSNGSKIFVGENALVYNGGSVRTIGSGIYDIKGNVMVVGSSSDAIRTLNSDANGPREDGENFILKLNDPENYTTSTYGQLFISGLVQDNITAIVDKEFRTAKHGTGNYFQQIALPFFDKTLSTLSTELGKTFGTTRFTQNEILKWHNTNVVSIHYTNLGEKTSDPTGYYMLGSNDNNLNVSIKHTLRGRPYADDATNMAIILKGAGVSIDYGLNGTKLNQYRERYNSYLQDSFDSSTGSWVNNYGKNLYQFGNPFFTNLDLSKIAYIEDTAGDGNQLSAIQGISYDPGTVVTLENGSTLATGAQMVTFTSATVPVGDLGLSIKPMQTFIVKLNAEANDINDTTRNTLNFKTLRRFKSDYRTDNNYHVTAKKVSGKLSTVKQLGLKGLDSNGNEIARAYYVVYPDAVSGHTTETTAQATNSGSSLMGTFEEDKVNGGYDSNYTGQYWLYINEANEYDFEGKAIPFNLYSDHIKFLKFEILENTIPIADGSHQLSTGIGFYYKTPTGVISEIKQNQIMPVSSSQYNLYYGKGDTVLSSIDGVKPSRTMVVYNPEIDNFVVRFDSNWNHASIKVFDMSGRMIQSKNNVKTTTDFPLNLVKTKSGYVITAISDNGEVVTTKILR